MSPLSGNIAVTNRNGSAATPGSAGAPIAYTPTRDPALGPNAPTAPIPGMPQQQAPQVPPEQQEAPQEGQEGAPVVQEAWRLAVVAQKDKQARMRLQEARAAEARARGREEALAAREEAIRREEEQRAIWRQNPNELLRAHGYNPESALQFMLNGQQMTPEQKLAATVDAKLDEANRRNQEAINRVRDEEARREQARQQAQQREAQAYQQQEAEFAVREFKGEIAEFLQADPTYKVVTRLAGDRGVDAIFEEIDNKFRTTGKRISLKEASDTVRAQLIKNAQELVSDQEVAAQLGVSLTPSQRAMVRPPPVRTLQNNMGASTGQTLNQRPETEAEKRARVSAQIEGLFRQRRQG